MGSPSFSSYDVFISHAGEDKTAIAFPLREMLLKHGIHAFVDEKDMPGGTQSINAMTEAMKTATVAVVVLSPEFVAREWPMKELLCFLRRTEKPLEDERLLSTVYPVFYRLGAKELHNEPQFDRRDTKGESLYHTSRFFERQANGNPEANVANIKEALRKLHRFMGLENYADASNESTSKTSKRREDLLNRLREEVRGIIKNKKVDFRCHYHKEKDKVISGLVLDFKGTRHKGHATTIEADVLKTVIDTSKNTNVISIRGIGGVGKSSILQGLSTLDVVKQRYKDGIHLLSLGPDATRSSFVKSLSNVVRAAGGNDKADEISRFENCINALNALQSWFSGKDCLFMVDNIWETAEISSGIIYELVTLEISMSKSKILFATRSTDIAFEAEKMFLLQPREPLSPQCRKILFLHSEIEVDESNDTDYRAVDEILVKCSGLPLFLKLAGKAVKVLNDKLSNKGCVAYHRYASKLHLRLKKFLSTPAGSYERLSLTLDTSVQIVEHRKVGWDFRAHPTAFQMHRRLSALSSQSRVPMSTLMHLWELNSEDEASVVSEEFEQLGLATLEMDNEDSEHAETLSLHDSLHKYAEIQTEKHGEENLRHKILLSGYGRGLETEYGYREWWSSKLEVDGYVHRNLCDHLLLAGLETELIELLLKPEWTVRCFEVCGILDLERDYRLGMIALKKMEEEDENRILRDVGSGVGYGMASAMQMLAEAMRLASGFSIRSPRELCFQLYGRLKYYMEENVFIKKHLNRLEEKASELWGPWMRCVSSVLTPPGGTTTRIHHVGPNVIRMASSDDGIFVFCVCFDGVIAIVDLSSGEVVKQPLALLPWTGNCTFSRDGRFVFAGTLDGRMRMWETKSGDLKKTLPDVNGNFVKSIGVMEDGRLVTADWRGMVHVRLPSGERLLNPRRVHDGLVLCMAALPGGAYLVSGGSDKRLRIWSANSGVQSGKSFVGHDKDVTCVSVMRRGRFIVSGSEDGTVRLWEIEKRKQVGKSFKRNNISVTCVAVSSDGKTIVSGSGDATICVWDVQSGGCNVLKAHTDEVTGVMFHPVDKSVISCSYDGTVCGI